MDSTADGPEETDLSSPDEPGESLTAAERRVTELEAEVESLKRELENREQERRQLVEEYENELARVRHAKRDLSDSLFLKLLRLLGLR